MEDALVDKYVVGGTYSGFGVYGENREVEFTVPQ